MSISPENSSVTSKISQDTPLQAPAHGVAPARPVEQTITYRVAPSITGFVVAGILMGFLASFLSTLLGPGSEQYTFGAVFGVLAIIFGAAGAALGAIIALILDKASFKRARTYRAVPED